MRRLTHLGDAWVTIGAGLLVVVLGDARPAADGAFVSIDRFTIVP